MKKDFAEIVREILIVERRKSVREVADALGIEYPNFYARVTGRVFFRPNEIAKLFKIIPDKRLFDCLLRDSGYIAVERSLAQDSTASGGSEDAISAAFRLSTDTLSILKLLSGGIPTPQQSEEIRSYIYEAERAVAALRVEFEQFAENTARRRSRFAAAPAVAAAKPAPQIEVADVSVIEMR